MIHVLPEKIIALAKLCPRPLYVVGGSVRDFLDNALADKPDWDLASACTLDEFVAASKRLGFSRLSIHSRLGSIKVSDRYGLTLEFTRFRHDTYSRGRHVPIKVEFTDDIMVDAERRDFRCNAVYYDICAEKFVDPLNGIEDIHKKLLRTTRRPALVFGEDALRFMRFARQAAETGYKPDPLGTVWIKINKRNIHMISPERIFQELHLLLISDLKRGERFGPYRGLHILKDTGILNEILPELAAGDGLHQDACFYKYDVLEHSFRTVLYAPYPIRLAALLHDVGKPYMYSQIESFQYHDFEGERITREILTRLSAHPDTIEKTAFLVGMHMKDADLEMYEGHVRNIIFKHRDKFFDLLGLMQADYSAHQDDLSMSPVVAKWNRIYQKMIDEGVPFSVDELAVDGNDALAMGIRPQEIHVALRAMLHECLYDGTKNNREYLLHYLETF